MSKLTSKTTIGKFALSSLFLLCSAFLSMGSATAQNNPTQTKAPAANQQNNAAQDIYQKNKLARCNIFAGDMKLLCQQQIMDGPIEGSVQQGGTLYEPAVLETILLVPEE